MKSIRFWGLMIVICAVSCAGTTSSHTETVEEEKIITPGAWQTEAYFPLLAGKRVALVGNHTSLVGGVHLADTLLAAGINLVKVFSPEHGFRGVAAAGEYVQSGVDPQTGLPVVSLYGTNRRPDSAQLKDIDIIIFDIQDVGVRFYTYISTMAYVMEEAARQQIPMLILDRPNPNGHFVDGPIMESRHSSFVGLHPIPVVHGMTVAEYARMVNGQGWLADGLQCKLEIVSVKNYQRTMYYELPVAPSPNLPNMTSIMLYPGLCYFEGSVVSLGRGTDFPFQVYGHPQLPAEKYSFTFTPESRTAAPNPPQLGNLCHGKDLRTENPEKLMQIARLDLSYIIRAYEDFPEQQNFFNNFFERLSGTNTLREQIKAGKSEEDIRASWHAGLQEFIEMRRPYLIYPDNY